MLTTSHAANQDAILFYAVICTGHFPDYAAYKNQQASDDEK
jgi:hypothetical protein